MPGFISGDMSEARILVVDDSDVLRTVFCRLLARAGYEVLSARTGQECLRVVTEQQRRVRVRITALHARESGGYM